MDKIHSHEVDDKHVLVDVRTPGEFHSEKIPNAVNIPLDKLAEQAESLENHDNIVLVCASGNRAKTACEVLSSRGISATILSEGMKGWKSSGRLTEVSDTGAISLERQVRIVAGSLVAVGGLLALFVHPYWAILSTFVGCGLVFAGVTDTCGMAMLLTKLPYNQKRGCSKCI
jgi:rhodanese-related sulfurtransferase